MIVSSVDKILMNRRQALGVGLGLAAAAAGLSTAPAAARSNGYDTALDFDGAFNPKRAEHNTLAFCKLMADTRDGVESCGYFKGNVLAYVGPKQRLEPLFGFEGFGMTRTIQVGEYAWRKLHKEVAYYTDLKTGEVMNEWHNPLSDEKVKVVPVHNDVVNSTWAPTYSFGVGPEKVTFPFVFPWLVMGDNAVVDFGVNTAHPAVLQPDKWPRESHGEITQVMEAIQIHTTLSDLMDPKQTAVQASGSWQRISPWLPWMLMGQTPGHLFYKTVTRRMKEGVEGLPPHILEYTKANFPDYLAAPSEWQEPNVSSYEVYEREMKPQPPKNAG
ncbi:MAG: DUF1838 family protein [Pseudomonadota bacterium]